MRKSTIYLFILGVAVMVMAAIASAGFVVSAQNSNSSMTNMNMAKPKPQRETCTTYPITKGPNKGGTVTICKPAPKSTCNCNDKDVKK